MKKTVVAFLLSGMILTSMGQVHAAEENLPYVPGLGYESDVVEEPADEIRLYIYDSG